MGGGVEGSRRREQARTATAEVTEASTVVTKDVPLVVDITGWWGDRRGDWQDPFRERS
jgi:hypothetical protein